VKIWLYRFLLDEILEHYIKDYSSFPDLAFYLYTSQRLSAKVIALAWRKEIRVVQHWLSASPISQ